MMKSIDFQRIDCSENLNFHAIVLLLIAAECRAAGDRQIAQPSFDRYHLISANTESKQQTYRELISNSTGCVYTPQLAASVSKCYSYNSQREFQDDFLSLQLKKLYDEPNLMMF